MRQCVQKWLLKIYGNDKIGILKHEPGFCADGMYHSFW